MESPQSLAQSWSELLPEIRATAKVAASLRRAAERLATPAGYEALRRLDRDLTWLESQSGTADPLLGRARDAARPVREWLANEWEVRAATFAGELAEWFSSRSVDLNVDDSVLFAAPFHLSLDAARDKAAISYAGEAVKVGIPLTVDRVWRAWTAARSQLDRDATAPERFADLVLESTKALADGPGRRLRRVRLPDLHFRLFLGRQSAQARLDPRRTRLKEYPRYQFAWDVAQLLEEPTWLRRPEGSLRFVAASESQARSRGTSLRVVRMDGTVEEYVDVEII
jgi:hypothetical protein